MLTPKVKEETLNRVTIKIMGDEYTVVGPESPEYIHHLVETIQTKIDAIQKAHGDAKLSKTQLAILVALQITDELEKLRIDHENLEKLIQAAK
ncbi:MAG TPA: cell division protein ZapA [Capillibacterium sp.]